VSAVLLDTTVVSAMRRLDDNAALRSWLARHDAADFRISTVTEMELLAGVMKLERRDPGQGLALRAWFERMMAQFEGKILSFDSPSARWAASIGLIRTRGLADTQVAGIALAAGMPLATLNRKDFDDIPGLTLVDLAA
jgi:predicted nucleic acid-binding protein